MKRTEIREQAFRLIYSTEIQKIMDDEQKEIFLEENGIDNKQEMQYIDAIFNGVKEKSEDIKQIISENLKEKWTIDRISKIDLAILRVAIYEMIYTDLPYKIVINEAVELAKKYGDDSSKAFVNGVLASVVKKNNLNSEEQN